MIQAKSYELSEEDQERFEHKERHELLHNHLDELIADFIKHTSKLPSKTSLIEFLEWSYEQTINPT